MRAIRFYLLSFLLIFCSQLANSQITGKIPKSSTREWVLKNIDGTHIPVHKDTAGNYTINISQLKKGIYDLTDVGEIYLEPQFKIEITTNKNQYVFKGKGSKENNLIQQANEPLRKLRANAVYGINMAAFLMEPKVFLPKMDDYEKGADRIFNKSSNVWFRNIAKQNAFFVKRVVIGDYMLFYGLDSTRMEPLKKLLSTPLAERKPDYSTEKIKAHKYQFSKHFTVADTDTLNAVLYANWNLNNEELFKNSAAYQELVGNKISYISNLPVNKSLRDSVKNRVKMKLLTIDQEITNKYINEYLNYASTLQLIKGAKNVSDATLGYEEFLAKNTNPAQRKEVEVAYANLKGTRNKVISPGFSFVNNAGNIVTLESLRGKYVYIDIWATWCEPCIAQIPALKKIEEQFKDKKISFVSISVDKEYNKEKWLKFVKDNELKGIQLMADHDFKSDFIQKYGINSIPRFLLIGPDGSIIDNDAKRPSNVELKAQLDKLL